MCQYARRSIGVWCRVQHQVVKGPHGRECVGRLSMPLDQSPQHLSVIPHSFEFLFSCSELVELTPCPCCVFCSLVGVYLQPSSRSRNRSEGSNDQGHLKLRGFGGTIYIRQ